MAQKGLLAIAARGPWMIHKLGPSTRWSKGSLKKNFISHSDAIHKPFIFHSYSIHRPFISLKLQTSPTSFRGIVPSSWEWAMCQLHGIVAAGAPKDAAQGFRQRWIRLRQMGCQEVLGSVGDWYPDHGVMVNFKVLLEICCLMMGNNKYDVSRIINSLNIS